MLDDETRDAAKRLATRYGCSTSEAIRRAVLAHRNTVFGVSGEVRRRRVKALERLIELFDGHDAEAEIVRRKAEDEIF